MTTGNSAETANRLAADRPIARVEFDRFGRGPFATAIAKTLAGRVERDGLVIGVYGQWGDGKTSVLNMVEYELAAAEGIKTVAFNPWLVRSAEQLLPALMATVSEAVNSSKGLRPRDLAREFSKYAEVAGHLDTRVAAAARGLKAVSTLTVERQKEQVGRTLADKGIRLVVIVDDIDRLDTTEMASILKLVKLTADFPYVSYLLAFDEQVVGAALSKAYGDLEGGRRFLEKIVQVPLHLPSPEVGTLEAFGFELLIGALEEAGVQLEPIAFSELQRRYVLQIGSLLPTPRAAIRFANGLRFSLQALKHEINVTDLVALEAIRTARPDVYRVLPGFAQVLLGTYVMQPTEQAVRADAQRLLARAHLEDDSTTTQTVTELLRLLFPYFAAVLEGRARERWDPGQFESEQRIAGPRYFARAFTLRVASSEIPDVQISTLLDARGADVDGLVRNYIEVGQGESLVAAIRRRAPTVEPQRAEEILLALARSGAQLPRPDISFDFQTPLIQAAIAVRQLLERLDQPARDATAQMCIALAGDLPFATQLVSWIASSSEGEMILTTDGRRRVLDEYIARLVNDSRTGVPLYTRYARDSSLIFALWAEYGDPAASDAYVRSTLESDGENALRFLSTYAPFSFTTGPRTLGDLGRDQYRAIAKVVSAEALAKVVAASLGDPPTPAEFPATFGRPATLRDLGLQFLFLHRTQEYGDS